MSNRSFCPCPIAVIVHAYPPHIDECEVEVHILLRQFTLEQRFRKLQLAGNATVCCVLSLL